MYGLPGILTRLEHYHADPAWVDCLLGSQYRDPGWVRVQSGQIEWKVHWLAPNIVERSLGHNISLSKVSRVLDELLLRPKTTGWCWNRNSLLYRLVSVLFRML